MCLLKKVGLLKPLLPKPLDVRIVPMIFECLKFFDYEDGVCWTASFPYKLCQLLCPKDDQVHLCFEQLLEMFEVIVKGPLELVSKFASLDVVQAGYLCVNWLVAVTARHYE